MRGAKFLNATGAGAEGSPDGGVGLFHEIDYFYETVQGFLYPDLMGKDPVLHWYTRGARAPKEIRARLWDGLDERCLWSRYRVDRFALGLMDVGVAVVAMELTHLGVVEDRNGAPDDNAPVPLTLALAQDALDQLRRTHAPFWINGVAPGRSPSAVQVLYDGDEGWTTHSPGPAGLQASAQAHLLDHGAPAKFGWWTELLKPLELGKRKAKSPLSFRQIVDERAFQVATISLGGGPTEVLEQVSDGDWHRIGAADVAGRDPWPYNKDFLDRTEPVLFYDRFAPHPEAERGGASRITICSYQLAAVGCGWFFENHVVHHVRRHYTQMVLLAYLEQAALLAFSARLTDLARKHAADLRNPKCDRGEARHDLRQDLAAIADDFVEFSHVHRFTGVSNQVQARELNDMLRGAIGLDALFEEVSAELDRAMAHAAALESERAANSAERLTEIATIAAVIGLGFTLAPVLGDLPVAGAVFGKAWAQTGAGCTLSALFAFLAVALGPVLRGRRGTPVFRRGLRGILWAICVVCAVAAVLISSVHGGEGAAERGAAEAPAPSDSSAGLSQAHDS
ncbi:hypothetical protein ACQ5SO_10455 [Rhodovulum sp. DZ06]|uniref:hypothetical protein n=1 Tax=Rhodovulum sp. DZ06 TaxID=3425126 RepID=UPI003D333050